MEGIFLTFLKGLHFCLLAHILSKLRVIKRRGGGGLIGQAPKTSSFDP
jgi:hypothetical protein